MPTLRVMNDGRPFPVAGGQMDRHGIAVFKAGGGNTIKVTVDYTAFLGDETYSSGEWACNGGTLGTATQTGAVVTSLVLLPTLLVGTGTVTWSGLDTEVVDVVHRLTTSGGRIVNTPVRFWLQPASGTDLFVLDGAYLA